LYYFESFYFGNIKSPSVKRLVKIEMEGVPKWSGDKCQPNFKIFMCHGKPIDPELVFVFPETRSYSRKKDEKIELKLKKNEMERFTLYGDVKISMDHKSENMFRIMFNTAFIPPSNCLDLGKMELSPEDIRKDKDKKIAKDFRVRLYFKDFCKICDPSKTRIINLCGSCKTEMGQGTLDQWQAVS